MIMETKGKILVVDDSLTSLKLIKSILSEQGYMVYTANSGLLALSSVTTLLPDLILLDVRMSGMDGFEVCEKLKVLEGIKDIPVIFLSGLTDTDDKVKGFELGAVDFISKPFQNSELLARVKTHVQMHRMHLIMEQQATELRDYNEKLELEIIKRKQTEDDLRESENLFKTTLYSIGDAVITTDTKGTIRQMNFIAETLTGYTEAEAKGKPIESVFQIINEFTREIVISPVSNVLENGHIVGLANHTLLISKDGTEYPIADSGAPIKNEKGELIGTVLVFRDQSREHQILSELKKSECKYKSIVDSSPMGMYFYELQSDGMLVFGGANPAADKIIGIGHNKYIGKTIQEAFPNLANTHVPEMYSKVAAGETDTQQFEIEYHDEQQINGFYSVTVFQSGKNFVTVQFNDISEQKQAEIALKTSEEKFRQVFEHSPIGKSMTMIDGTLRVNKAFCEMLGYTEEELKNKNWQEITHPNDIEESKQAIQTLMNGEADVNYEKRYLHKNGSTVYTNVFSKLQRDEKNNPAFFITSVINITRRKLAEEKLIRSEHELKKAQQITHIGSWYLDVATNEVVWSEELYRMYGFDPSLPPPPYSEHKKLFTPKSWETLSTSLAQTTETGTAYELELETVRYDGSNGWMWVRGETVQDVNGKTIGLWGASQDISERKKTELLLQQQNDEIIVQNEEFQQLNEELDQTNLELLRAKTEAEEGEIRYHTVVSNTPMVTFVLDSKGIFTLSEGKGLEKLGLKPGQVVGLSAIEVYKEYPSVVQVVQNALAGKNMRSELALSGVIFDVIYTPVFDNRGNVIEVIGVANDITERKIAEQQLRESEMRSRSTFDQSPVGSVIVGLDKRFIKCNAAFCQFLGYSEDELNGKTISDVTFPDDIELGMLDMKLMIEGKKESSTVQKRYKRKDGTIVWGEVTISLGRDAENRPLCFLPIIQNITERKVAEENLKKFKMGIENSKDAIFITDINGTIEYTNPAFEEIYGYSSSETIDQTPRILKSGKLTQIDYEHFWKTLLEKKSIVGEIQNKTKSGKIISIDASNNPILNNNSEIIGFISIHRDINERKKTENALKESEEKFAKVFHDASVLIAITDMNDATYIDVNEQSIKVSGFSREEIIGHTATEIGWIKAEDQFRMISEIKDKGQFTRLEIDFKAKDGRIISGWVNGDEIIIGGKSCLLTVTIDITEHKILSEEIQKEKKLLRTLINNIPDAIYVKDELGRKLITNPADLRILNFTNESEILGKTDLEIIPGIVGERGYNDDMEVIKTGQPIINKQEFFLMPNGERYWLLTSKLSISNNEGKITGLVGIGRDITESKKAEEIIIKLSTALEQSPLTIIITNIKGEIEYTNPKFTQITGYTPSEAKGQNPRILKSCETSSEDYTNLWTTISSGKEWHGEFHNKKKNGELYWEAASISPIRNEDGEIINYIAIKEDITNQKQLMNELVESKEKAEESDRLKSAFLANMSHEIRTPLNGILGFSELLADPDFDQDQKAEMARLVLDNGDQLLAIINDVLDISKIEAGQIEIHKKVFSVNQMISDIQKTFLTRASIMGVEFKIDPTILRNEIQLNSDYMRIKQVLTNLVSNALKFTDKGSIEIGLSKNKTELIFHVKDTGLGIPKEFQEKIFERFRHLEPNRSKVIGGNGLGLSISKSFVEMLGGKIWVESEVGQGSCFYFSIPI